MVLGALALVVLLVVAACARIQGDDDGPCDDVGTSAAVAGTFKPRPPARPAAPAAPPRVSVSKAPAAPPRSVSKVPAATATRTVTAKPGHGSSHGHVDVDLDCG
jgi:hypothetical protein